MAAKLTGWHIDIKSESEVPVSLDTLFKEKGNEETDAESDEDANTSESEEQSLKINDIFDDEDTNTVNSSDTESEVPDELADSVENNSEVSKE